MGGVKGVKEMCGQSEELVRSPVPTLPVENAVMQTEDARACSEQNAGQADTRVCCSASSIVREAGEGSGG